MYIIFKDKKSKVEKKSQSSRNQGSSYFFLPGDRRIQEAQKPSGSGGSGSGAATLVYGID
jgi:hypothetical protein